ncbi:hypothetical protein HZ992_16100 [Rhizobacter sp. AJA081-3]|uniref:hypothetical protein n=1 Tax=Rhizobacter sp. AJA081-3 TaxID=2753607 RepID=UPI001AE0E5CA|nr:hypothetical protein [Rhizobacter sp. AJA081-3]QTN21695.1 hypothetical protein HZ992_16100 [Rhizobacter sp. AJA081-3]
MKVTKAKGLEHDLAAARGSQPEAAVEHPGRSIDWFGWHQPSTAEPCSQRQQPDRIQALFFGSFLLGQQKKGSRRPGETGGFSRRRQ